MSYVSFLSYEDGRLRHIPRDWVGPFEELKLPDRDAWSKAQRQIEDEFAEAESKEERKEATKSLASLRGVEPVDVVQVLINAPSGASYVELLCCTATEFSRALLG